MSNVDTTLPAAKPARPWLLELTILFGLMLVTTLIFWNTDLDVSVSGIFYHPTSPIGPWHEGLRPFWQFFYQGAPAITGLLVFGCIGVLVFVRKSTMQHHRLRLYAMYMLLLVVLGPGLLINGVFKGYWGRPRPSETLQLGGTQAYLPPLMMGQSQMYKSFPAGHATTGFMFMGFFFILRRRHKLLARLALLLTIMFGLLMGTGRIVAGGHFLSDVLWAGYLTFLTATVLYHFILHFPRREQRIEQSGDMPIPRLGLMRSLGYLALVLVMIFATLLASPFDTSVDQKIRLTPRANLPVLNYQLDRGDVILQIDNHSDDLVSLQGTANGFGLPTNELKSGLDDKGTAIVGSLVHKGVYTELITHYLLKVNLNRLQEIELQLQHGTIHVADRLTPEQKAKLHLRVKSGKIIWTE
jgi:lipid A 4'-phosphatase